MGLTSDQILGAKKWNEIIAAKVEDALGSQLDGKFTAANYTAGFNYQVKLKNYNANSLMALNTRVEVKKEIPYLTSSYTSLYNDVIGKLIFNISKEDRVRINQEQNAQSALIASIINSYKQSDIDDEPMQDPTVPKIMKRIKDFTGDTFDKVNLREYPYLSNLCNLLSEFARKAVFTSKIQRAAAYAEDRLEAIKEHITTPDEKNGGLKTDGGYVCGWENIKEPAQLLESLEGGNKISFTVSAGDFHEKNSTLTFNNKAKVIVPFNWFFNLSADHSDKYDLSKFTKNGAQLSLTVIYDGVTVVPANPTVLSADNKRGWYAGDILEEAAAKSGKDVTGYQLIDSEFNPKTIFGANGKLRRMRTLIISQQPTVKLHFSKFDCSQLKKTFDEKTDVEFNIMDLVVGHHENGYSVSECDYKEDSQTLDVTLTPQKLGSSGTAESQTAFVLGGVEDYFENNVEVNKIQILPAKESDEYSNALPEEFNGLMLRYRKNKDGRYEYAGFYDENNDLEYMSGDNVAVPITSQYLGTALLEQGATIRNVERSSHDYAEDEEFRYWIQYWILKTRAQGNQIACSVCDNFAGCSHNHTLVGAHVVINGHNVVPNPDEEFYIIPLCQYKNNYHNHAPMTLTRNVVALRLNRFIRN